MKGTYLMTLASQKVLQENLLMYRGCQKWDGIIASASKDGLERTSKWYLKNRTSA